MAGKLVTRNTGLEAPKGMKKVLVFGVITVPEETPVGNNRIVDINDDLEIDPCTAKPLAKKYAAWDADALCEQMFGNTSMREHNEMIVANRGLRFIKDGKFDDPEFQDVVTKLRKTVKNMPPLDSMRQIFLSIIDSFKKRSRTLD